jgi:hypothetical protein
MLDASVDRRIGHLERSTNRTGLHYLRFARRSMTVRNFAVVTIAFDHVLRGA